MICIESESGSGNESGSGSEVEVKVEVQCCLVLCCSVKSTSIMKHGASEMCTLKQESCFEYCGKTKLQTSFSMKCTYNEEQC